MLWSFNLEALILIDDRLNWKEHISLIIVIKVYSNNNYL